MERSRKAGFGLATLVAVALVAAFAAGATAQGWVFASPSAQTGPGTQQPTGANSKQAAAATEQQLLNNFMANFAARLGVDEAKLNSAFIDSVNSTVDQAVRDGTITQAQADEAKNTVSKSGFRGILEQGLSSSGQDAAPSTLEVYANPKSALVETMNKIGVSTDQLQQGIQAGKSLADLAREHNVDAATLQSMMLQTYKTHLDSVVHDGKITQAQADDLYNQFAGQVAAIINGTNQSGSK